ncbi:MAG: rod shape-determining protein RodA [Flavobacteriales bacterium]
MQNSRQISVWGKIDIPLLVSYFILVAWGYLTIYSASFKEDFPDFYDINKEYGRQLIFIGISLFIGTVILLMEGSFFSFSAYIIYGIVFLLLIGVLFTKPINGARSWFQLGGFSLQPSEFAKLATSLALAKYLSSSVKLEDFKTKLTSTLLMLIPVIVIMMQPDVGTVLVFFSFILVLYREGLSGNILLFILFSGILAVLTIFLRESSSAFEIFGLELNGQTVLAVIVTLLALMVMFIIKYVILLRYRKRAYFYLALAWIGSVGLVYSTDWIFDNVLKEHHRSRIKINLGLLEDRRGDGYNVFQAMSAVGSGGVAGKGYMEGTLSNERYRHVPEQSTDFIFCSLSEEWGFLGSTLMFLAYLFFLIRIILIAERQRSHFTRIFAYCTASIFFMHFFVNVGMVIGLAPVIGIPLPFFSYGGSSIIAFSIFVFILLRLDAERKDVLR